jgi:hypothetical protein
VGDPDSGKCRGRAPAGARPASLGARRPGVIACPGTPRVRPLSAPAPTGALSPFFEGDEKEAHPARFAVTDRSTGPAERCRVRRAGEEDDRRHELKPLVAIQRVQLPPGKGSASQPEASLARWRQRHSRSVWQQVPKLRVSPEISHSRSLRRQRSGGSIDATVTVRACRFDRGPGAEQRHGRDRLKT